MIYDKKAKTCVDIFTNAYFRDYEVAVNTDGIILLLQKWGGNFQCRFAAFPGRPNGNF